MLDQMGALEVKTPVLSTFPDLVPFPQFVTTHPLTGTQLCLRFSPEEHLMRLIACGVPAVYELSTNFRCGTVDQSHLIEFESLQALFSGTPLAKV